MDKRIDYCEGKMFRGIHDVSSGSRPTSAKTETSFTVKRGRGEGSPKQPEN